MPPAARTGDPTGHGSALGPGPGSANVLIGGAPAWRCGADMHACPLANGTIPHVGGSVAVGSSTVLVNGMPAARLGDSIVECGGPDPIAAGCPTVLVG